MFLFHLQAAGGKTPEPQNKPKTAANQLSNLFSFEDVGAGRVSVCRHTQQAFTRLN